MAVLKTKSGSSFNTKTGVKTSASGQTTQVRAAKPTQQAGQTRSDFLKSLNKPGSSQYIPTPDDKGFEQMDVQQNLKAGATPQAIDTTQPSPTTTQIIPPNAQTPTVPFEQASKAIQTSGQSATDIARATDILKQKYQGGFQQTAATGAQAPATAGQAAGTIAGTVPPAPADTTFIDTTLNEDSFMTSIMDSINEFMSPTNQRDTLVKEYERMEKESGLAGIDKELLNARNIIEGTEDDIRNEVTKAGGFATDSQVQAMANARNKSLIKNYNNLLETRNSISDRLDTMMNLSKEDKRMAQEKLANQLDLGFKLVDYRDKMKQNSADAYNKIVEAVGYKGLSDMTKGDPYYTSLVEKSLGLGSGGLAKLASAPMGLKDQLLTEQIKTEKAQRAKIYSEITKTSGDDKAKLRQQNMLNQANTVITKVDEALTQVSGATTGFFGGISKGVPGTAAYNLEKTIDTIKSNVGFQALQAMREASPTGGALGQVAVQELNMLQSTIASLDIGQSKDQITSNLMQVKTSFENVQAIILADEEGKEITYTPDGRVVILEK